MTMKQKLLAKIKFLFDCCSDCCDFDSKYYLDKYPDVAKSGMNPLFHYLRHGKVEGRSGKNPDKKWDDYTDVISNMNLSDTDKVIAVVTHDFSRSGCPINAWNIVKALKKNYKVIVISRGRGPLKEDFVEIADAVIIIPRSINSNPKKISDFLEKQIASVPLYFCLANSSSTIPVLTYFAEKKISSMLLVHEFANSTSFSTHKWLDMGFCYATQVVYSSRIVLDSALKELGIDYQMPILPQGLSEIPNVKNRELTEHEKDLLNQLYQFKLEENGKIVVAVGTVDCRKGTDLFVKVAAKTKKLCSDQAIKFLWIGDGFNMDTNIYSRLLYAQIKEYGLQDDFIFAGQVIQMDKYYKLADLLLMTSRMDPLPGVVIEAIINKIPAVCFEKCSGFPEYFKELGLDICIARYLSTSDMAEKTAKLLKDKNLYSLASAKLYDLAKERFNMGNYTNSIMDMMPDVIKANEEDIENVEKAGSSDFLSSLKAYRARKLGLMGKEE